MKRMTALFASIILAHGFAASSRAQEPAKPGAAKPEQYRKAVTDGLRYLAVAAKEKEEPKLGEYWVGMEVTQPSDDERKKLEIPADHGIVVQQVVPDSPAAKAGLKVGDVLLAAGDKPLKELTDALEAIRTAGNSELAFEFKRDGKTAKVTLKPTKRPSGYGFEEAVTPPTKAFEGAEAQREYIRARAGLSAALEAAGGIEKIRRDLQQVRERLGAIDKELAQLETARGGANRDRLNEEAAALKQAIGILMKGGRTADADRLRDELKRLIEQREAAERGGSGSLNLPSPVPRGAPVALPAEGRIAVFEPGERAVRIAEEPGTPVTLTYRVAPPRPESEPSIAELRKQVDQLRRELKELRDQAAKAKKE
jgi:membrane-associated protease RseP (regulator of RpoE activity)